MSKFLKSIKCFGDEVLYSLDIESLFTNIPINEACKNLEETLLEEGATPLIATEITRITKFCMDSTYFVYNNQHYQQTHSRNLFPTISKYNIISRFFYTMILL